MRAADLWCVEWIKSRRTPAPWAVIALPLGIVVLKTLAMGIQGEAALGPQRWNWTWLLAIGGDLWRRLVLPFLAIVLTAWSSWLEGERGGWKLLLTQPARRSSIYSAKLLMVMALIAVCLLGWLGFHLLAGWLLGLPTPVPWGWLLRDAALSLILIWPTAAVQHWIACCSRGFQVPLGVGLAGLIAGISLSGTALGNWLPWAYPGLPASRLLDSAPLSALALGTVLCLMGGFHFVRRDFH